MSGSVAVVPLGATKETMSRIGLGAMPLSIAGRPERARAIAVVVAAVEAGIDLIDTADAYCLNQDDAGHNERLIAEALKSMGHAARAVRVATKGGIVRPSGQWVRRGDPSHLERACEMSLKALGRETIDLYQWHAPDPKVPFADSVGMLGRLKACGKIRHVGLSNVDIAQIDEARGIVPITSVQNRLNVLDRGSADVADHCRRHAITFLAYGPVGGHHGRARLAEHPPLVRIAEALHATPEQIALAWLIDQGDHIVPIPGATKLKSVKSSIEACRLRLNDTVRRDLGSMA